MDKLIITTAGISFIGLIYWFFFGKKDESMESSEKLTITVDGGYKPSTIRIPKNKLVTLTFLRKDPNTCLEDIVFPDYKIKKYLPLNKAIIVSLSPPHKQGSFHCGMNMYHGKILVS